MYKLNSLSSSDALCRRKKRLGRGIGSGKGKTSGRGHKGQKSRSGVAIKGFEGGQNSIFRRLPKRGFSSAKTEIAEISIAKLSAAIDRGKIDTSRTVTEDDLYSIGLFSKKRKFVKILGNGEINCSISLEVSFATKSAFEKIINAGGQITLKRPKEGGQARYFDELALFKNCMNYEIYINKNHHKKRNISLVFGAHSDDVRAEGFDKINAIIDCPSYGVRDKVFSVGKAILKSETEICEFSFPLPDANAEQNVPENRFISIALFHRNRMFHKNIIRLNHS